MADTVHFAFLRDGRFSAFCNGAEHAVVTWASDLVTCTKCRARRMAMRVVRSEGTVIRLPTHCRICDAVAHPGEELTCGHYQFPGYLRRG